MHEQLKNMKPRHRRCERCYMLCDITEFAAAADQCLLCDANDKLAAAQEMDAIGDKMLIGMIQGAVWEFEEALKKFDKTINLYNSRTILD